jgi:hypothetical protein
MTGHRTDGNRSREATIETKNTRHKEVSLLAKLGVAVEKVRFPQSNSLDSIWKVAATLHCVSAADGSV